MQSYLFPSLLCFVGNGCKKFLILFLKVIRLAFSITISAKDTNQIAINLHEAQYIIHYAVQIIVLGQDYFKFRKALSVVDVVQAL